MQLRVVPFSRSFDTFGLTYSFDPKKWSEIEIGNVVQIPFKDQEIYGVIFDIFAELPEGTKAENIRNITDIIYSETLLSSEQIQLCSWIAEKYFTPIHSTLQVFLPKNLREKIIKKKFQIPENSQSNNKVGVSLCVDPKTGNKTINHTGQTHGSAPTDIALSKKQEEIYQNIKNSTDTLQLLYGVTGSGKTRIYMKLIADNLQKNTQTLLLVPEILLTNQVAQSIERVFGEENIVVLHSNVSEAKKTLYWQQIYTGEKKIIIGTRSALFYPYHTLGRIIIDEEHDQSYISDNSPRYHAGKVAEYISKQKNIPLLYGSGTPSIQIMYRALKGEIELFQLLEKYRK
ncbi:DEAD/DEAH box helicase family protein [Candidatus Gracilibacteria bacterium]|nr:DEAD/DEAH box helicase family protein [Candidatus Gracilibacteria bacterium]